MDGRKYCCLLLLITVFVTLPNVVNSTTKCGYESCPSEKPGMINVHLLPHTHDDVGWLLTVDQYYYREVQFILDSVIPELVADPSKRFIYVEIAFFSRWFGEQNDATRHLVQKLVNEGRLEFILGGWCMNDEASTHYTAIIDQHKLGFEYLRKNFGDCGRPHIGWQIDPFGHSREQASIFAQFGFDGLFFGRLDYQDKLARINAKTLEMIWKGSPKNLRDSANLFTGVLPYMYNPAKGFCYDISCASFNPVIKDDPSMHDYNKDDVVNSFINTINNQSKWYATKHIIMPMGSDFNYQAAGRFFSQMDKLIKYVNEKSEESGINVLYSTPSCYLKALNNDNRTWTSKEDDFFPYADRDHGFWTGYFTSRPAIKYYARDVNSFYQSVKQMAALAKLNNTRGNRQQLQRLGEVLGVAQHHDAISGTEKQAVAYDYAQRLAEGVDKAKNVVIDVYNEILPKSPGAPVQQQVFCSELNISICDVTETIPKFQVTFYNPLARLVNYTVRLPVSGSNYTVIDSDGATVIPSDLFQRYGRAFPVSKRRVSSSDKDLVFEISLPPLGLKTCFVQTESSKTRGYPLKFDSDALLQSKNSGSALWGKYVMVAFDDNGSLLSMTDLISHVTVPLKQKFLYYEGFVGDNHEGLSQASGAYIFRPKSNTPTVISFKEWSGVRKGELVEEAYQEFDNWVTQIIRVYKNKPYVEVEWTVGPIPIDDGVGKEIVTRYSVENFGNNGVFYTDANGREILERQLNYRPTWQLNQTEPVAGNYFPVNALISLKSDLHKLQFSVLTDRSQGGTSLNDGDVELMLHRRLLCDDGKGVGEALNETGVNGNGLIVRGKHYLLLSSLSEAPKLYRTVAKEIFSKPQMTFSAANMDPAEWKTQYNTEWSGLRNSLPDNVHLLTMEQFLHDGPVPFPHGSVPYLIRFEHFYEVGEDAILSQPVTFDMKNLFQPFNISDVHELSLGANVAAENIHRLAWRMSDGQTKSGSRKSHVTNTTITLSPMEMVTLQVNLMI